MKKYSKEIEIANIEKEKMPLYDVAKKVDAKLFRELIKKY